MDFDKKNISIAIAYLIVLLYVLFDNNPIITVILVLCLFVYHISGYIQLKTNLSSEKDKSVSKLQSKLSKTKQQEEESYKRFISLSTSFGSGLLLIDEEGIIQVSNEEANSYFGRDFENLDYQKITDIKSLYKFVNQAYLLESGMREQIIYNEKYYDLISTPFFEDDFFKGTFILIHDITLLKNAEKYQKRFTEDVSHELRTPLSAIKGFSEILSRNHSIKEEERKEFIDLIRTESERMEYIVNDLMIISKMDRIDYELELTQVEISQVIEESVAVLRNQIEAKGLIYTIDVVKQKLDIDKYKMSQVFLNILKNAINYTDKGELTIKSFIEKGQYIIIIQDTGIGIKDENLEKVFKRFYRVDKTRSRETGGSGLGLSISKNVVLKHGGTIEVSSQVNVGTAFTIKLPIKE